MQSNPVLEQKTCPTLQGCELHRAEGRLKVKAAVVILHPCCPSNSGYFFPIEITRFLCLILNMISATSFCITDVSRTSDADFSRDRSKTITWDSKPIKTKGKTPVDLNSSFGPSPHSFTFTNT